MNGALCAEHSSRNTLNAFIQRSRAFAVLALARFAEHLSSFRAFQRVKQCLDCSTFFSLKKERPSLPLLPFPFLIFHNSVYDVVFIKEG